ncbi:MAG: HEAT repeat domain-containing protein [Myxococcales bacterium]|nr:HEAT repeat domain-containing protein [Myxococcales bacterium]
MSLTGSSEETTAEAAERALGRAGLAGAEAARRALAEPTPGSRARLARVLSRVAVEHAEALRAPLLGLLADPEARVQRAAISGLGKIGGPEVEAALLGAFAKAELPEQRALVEALGKLGGRPSRTFLLGLKLADPELERRRARALVMLGRSVDRVDVDVDVESPVPHPVRVIFRCRSGVAPTLLEEVREHCHPSAAELSPTEVSLEWTGSLSRLLEVRTALDVSLEVQLDNDGPLDARVVAALRKSVPLLVALSSSMPRFRLAWLGAGHQRSATFRVADALRGTELINDPKGAPWEARVDERGQRLLLVARPNLDARFGYRGRDVPAASHPTLAAALARIGGVQPDDVVWDPFVGSGLELCERGLLGPFQRLIGTDLSEQALGAAEENLRRAGFEAQLVRADARSFDAGEVTLILTNPPMGRRVARDGELESLVEAFLGNVARCLSPRGRMVWLSPLPRLSAQRLEAHGLSVERRGAVDLGGFDAELQVARFSAQNPRTR